MICPSCSADTPPMDPYCHNCGTPLQADEMSLLKDIETRAREQALGKATREAKKLFIRGLFLLGAVIAMRFVILKEPRAEFRINYRVPYDVVEEGTLQGQAPPSSVPLERLPIPLPTHGEE